MKLFISLSRAEKSVTTGDHYYINVGTSDKPIVYVGEVIKVSGSNITFMYNGTGSRGKIIIIDKLAILGRNTNLIIEKTYKVKNYLPLTNKEARILIRRNKFSAPEASLLAFILGMKAPITLAKLKGVYYGITRGSDLPLLIFIPGSRHLKKNFTVTSEVLKSFGVSKSSLVKYLESIRMPMYATYLEEAGAEKANEQR